jgi:hypothetical protein
MGQRKRQNIPCLTKTKSPGIGALIFAWLDVCILFSLDTPVPPQGTVIFKPLGGLANRLEIVYF